MFAVLGATGGIGSELCRMLSRAGFHLAIAARDESRLLSLSRELGASYRSLDASDAEIVEQWLADILAEHGRLDGAVNCAGSLLLKPAHFTKPEEWTSVIRTNLDSAFSLARAAGIHMRQSGGSVVFVSSAAASVGIANHEAIAAAKAGVVGLARAAAATYAAAGLRFNVVAPGLTRTPLAERITSKPASARASEAMHALGRLGEPADVARAIAWFLDPGNSWVTGQVLGVDGGLGSVLPSPAAPGRPARASATSA